MKNILTILFTFCISVTYAQTLMPKVLSSSGKSKNVKGVILSYTLGQTAYSTYKNRIVLTQGFLQSTYLFQQAEEKDNINIAVVYPNPVCKELNIVIKDFSRGKYLLNVFDTKGTLIINRYLKQNIEMINFSGYPKGEYLIKIISEFGPQNSEIHKVIHF